MEKDRVKENRQGCLSHSIRAGAIKSAKRVALPATRPTKKTPCPNNKSFPVGGKDSVKENRQGCLSHSIRAAIFKSVQGMRSPHPDQQKRRPKASFLLVGMTGFEPATSASRTQRSTKLSHIPLRIPSLLSNGEGTGGCPTRIRTQTNRVRVCRATFTQSGNSNMNYYNGSGEKVKTYRKKTAFIFYFWRKVPLIARAARHTIHIAVIGLLKNIQTCAPLPERERSI